MINQINKKVEIVINNIEKQSKLPIQNIELFRRYVFDAIVFGIPITFFGWECPPRKISRTKEGDEYVDFCVDLDMVFKGKKIDNFTELPKIVEYEKIEQNMVELLEKLNIPFRLVKFIADTNAYYITPRSLVISDSKGVENKFQEFKNKLSKYPKQIEVALFTEVIKPYVRFYREIYQIVMDLLKNKSQILLSKAVIDKQIRRTKEHVGIVNVSYAREFSYRTIATYATEGVMFYLMSKDKKFSNCVWLNSYETDRRTIDITNCYRRKIGIEDLPMVFIYK